MGYGPDRTNDPTPPEGLHHRGGRRHGGGRGRRSRGEQFPLEAIAPRGPGSGLGRGRGGRGRRSGNPQRGDVRKAILLLLAEEPMHGYQVITEITERSGGVWRPSPGSVYPTLQQLQDEGLVTVEEADGRRDFTLTEAGRASLEDTGDSAPPWEALSDSVTEDVHELQRRAAQASAALAQVAAAGSDAQIRRAAELLDALRKELYRMLADDEAGPAGQP